MISGGHTDYPPVLKLWISSLFYNSSNCCPEELARDSEYRDLNSALHTALDDLQ